jgi:hypothetical protein
MSADISKADGLRYAVKTVQRASALDDRAPLEFEHADLAGHADLELAGFAGSHPYMTKLEAT